MQPMLTMAVRAAKQAGELIAKAAQQLQFVDIEVEAKGINDFVTRVDKNAERLIIENLRKAYPIHSFQGEESGFIEGQGVGKDWLWIIDPLDGTTNFIHGFPQYAVSIAVQHKGQTEHAVVYNPITEECFSASRGYGATLNGRRLRVTQRTSLDGALIGTGFPFRPDQHSYLDAYLSAFKAVAMHTAGIRRARPIKLIKTYLLYNNSVLCLLPASTRLPRGIRLVLAVKRLKMRGFTALSQHHTPLGLTFFPQALRLAELAIGIDAINSINTLLK
jgi:myo-inositol-1(or 4)-monophosphatase